MNKLWKAPFFHFLLIGTALFLLNWVFKGNKENPEDYTIIINDSDLNRLALAYEKNWGKLPDSSTLNLLLEEEIKSEILYREALRMQLDHNDEIIRRRLKQKYEFLIKDLKEQEIPTTSELKAFYEANKQQYQSAKKYSFNQIYFSPDHAHNPQTSALTLLEKIQSKNLKIEAVKAEADAFHLPVYFAEKDLEAVRQNFGKAFADSLFTVNELGWTQPLQSGYGVHLVQIVSLNPSTLIPLDEIKSDVAQDWKQDQLNQYNERLMAQLKAQYRVEYQFNKREQNK